MRWRRTSFEERQPVSHRKTILEHSRLFTRAGTGWDYRVAPTDFSMSSAQSNDDLMVGLFGIGLDTYWPQFEGLREGLVAYTEVVAQRLNRPGVKVVHLGLIDTPEKAVESGHAFRREDV